MKRINHYNDYLNKQLEDPEFVAQYSLAREKVKLEIYLEKLKENIRQDANKTVLIRNLNKISRYVKHIAL
jgi:hypothetical protein